MLLIHWYFVVARQHSETFASKLYVIRGQLRGNSCCDRQLYSARYGASRGEFLHIMKLNYSEGRETRDISVVELPLYSDVLSDTFISTYWLLWLHSRA